MKKKLVKIGFRIENGDLSNPIPIWVEEYKPEFKQLPETTHNSELNKTGDPRLDNYHDYAGYAKDYEYYHNV